MSNTVSVDETVRLAALLYWLAATDTGWLLLNRPFRSRLSRVGWSKEVASWLVEATKLQSLCAHTIVPAPPPEPVISAPPPISAEIPIPKPDTKPLPPPPPPLPPAKEDEIAFENDDMTESQYGNKIVGSVETIIEAPAPEGLSVGAIVGVAAAAAVVAAVLMALAKRRRNRRDEKELEPEYESQDDETFLDEEGVPPPPPMEA